MKAKLSKRIGAYLIDIMIVSIIFSILTAFIPESKNIVTLNSEIEKVSENFLNQTISASEYFNQTIILSHSLSKEMFLSNLFNFVLIIGCFVILPYYCNGQTIGKKLLKIKIVKEDGELGVNELIMRNIIVNEFAYTLISLALVFIASDNAYFWITSTLAFIQFLLVIISVFMIIYRKDKKGLQDIISNTQVIEDCVEVK